MEVYEVTVRFFQDGGPFMYPIAAVLVVGLAIAIERWLMLTSARFTNRRAFNSAMAQLKKQDFAAVISAGSNSSVPMSRIVAAGIARFAGNKRRDEVESAMEEGIMEALPRLEKRTQYLATLANVSTLLGLLGTIVGLISAFTAVTDVAAAEKASMLSSSISVAMNTTAFGLISAIPLLLSHAVLQTKTAEIVDSFEMASVKVLNALTDVGTLPAQTRVTD